MKKIVLALAIITTMSFSVSAGVNKDKRRSTEGRGRMMKELNLTVEQQEKLKSLRQDYQEKHKQLAESHHKDVEKILTPEQQTKWNELRENRKDRMKDGRRGHHEFSKKGKRYLNLDDETKQSMQTLKENFLKEKRAIEMSRIAPDMQKKKIVELKDKYRKEKYELIKKAEAKNPKVEKTQS